MNLDPIDIAILKSLQTDGRIANTRLAGLVGLSESACLRRVNHLEDTGVIDRYVMLVNPTAVGEPGSVFVRLTLEGQQAERLARFEAAVQNVVEVMECHLISGDCDYLLRVSVGDNSDYVRVHETLTALPGVLRVQSSFALRTVRQTTEIPIDPGAGR